jgi:hypothetical protein
MEPFKKNSIHKYTIIAHLKRQDMIYKKKELEQA